MSSNYVKAADLKKIEELSAALAATDTRDASIRVTLGILVANANTNLHIQYYKPLYNCRAP